MVRYGKVCCLNLTVAVNVLANMPPFLQLAFRQTVYKYGTDLCWTPMILAKEFNRNEFARDSGTFVYVAWMAQHKF